MGIIDKLLGYDKLKAQIKAATTATLYAQVSTLTSQVFPSWKTYKELEAYRLIDDIYSVVTRLAQTAADIPFYAYDNAGEYLPDNNKLAKTIAKLDYEKKVILYTYLYLTDECFIYKERLEFGVNAGIVNFHFLHPNYMTLVVEDTFPNNVTGYIYSDTARGIEMKFTADDIVFIKGFNPTVDANARFRGLSKISVLARTLTRLDAGNSASVAKMQNGGVPGIVYDKTGDFDRVEKTGARQEKFSRYLKNPSNKGAPYFGTGDMGYLALGLPLADLNVAELAAIDFKKICNAYGISDRLFNNDATGSEVSDDNARKGLYLNAIKPALTLVESAINREFVPDTKVPGYVRYDLTDIVELQEDMLKKAQALAAAPVMVPNDVLEALGYDRSGNPEMDLEYIKTGYQPISDFNPVLPVE